MQPIKCSVFPVLKETEKAVSCMGLTVFQLTRPRQGSNTDQGDTDLKYFTFQRKNQHLVRIRQNRTFNSNLSGMVQWFSMSFTSHRFLRNLRPLELSPHRHPRGRRVDQSIGVPAEDEIGLESNTVNDFLLF